MMIMSTADSTFFNLNEVATVIWESADGRTPLSEIVSQKICPQFEVTVDQAQQDADEFVKDLSQHGILRMSSEPIPTSAIDPA